MGENKYFLAILVTAIIMALFFYSDKKKSSEEKNDTAIELAIDDKNKIIMPVATPKSSLVSSDQSPTVSTNLDQLKISDVKSRVTESVMANYYSHMKNMAKCFGLQLTPASDKVEPNPENLMNHLRTSLGDAVVQMDDWSQTDIIENGKKKRIRVDFDYPDGATPSRRLSMYQINSYGMPEIINLTPDQTNDPNEAYISSLIEGHQVATAEKGIRAYYSEGEELIYTSKDGLLSSISISKGIRNFTCNNLTEDSSSCFCQ